MKFKALPQTKATKTALAAVGVEARRAAKGVARKGRMLRVAAYDRETNLFRCVDHERDVLTFTGDQVRAWFA